MYVYVYGSVKFYISYIYLHIYMKASMKEMHVLFKRKILHTWYSISELYYPIFHYDVSSYNFYTENSLKSHY